MADQTTGKSKRGFASMAPERVREIASMGGRSVAKENRNFARNRELAAAAGRKGGLATPNEKRAFTADKALASSAGRKGALSASSKAPSDKV